MKIIFINPLNLTQQGLGAAIKHIKRTMYPAHGAYQPQVIAVKNSDLMEKTHQIATALGYNLPQEFFFGWRIESAEDDFIKTLLLTISEKTHDLIVVVVNYNSNEEVTVLCDKIGLVASQTAIPKFTSQGKFDLAIVG
ncbi:MAG: hypothetical protein QG583_825 [Patescibacteria group bacterium]|nr:hypothetical protein [Patescibacteria group bacterium]